MLIIKTTSPLKRKAINNILNMSDDKIKEFIHIIEKVNNDEIKVNDIRNIKFILLGYLSEMLKKKVKKELY